MDYGKEIIEMIQNTKSTSRLRYIYFVLKSYLKGGKQKSVNSDGKSEKLMQKISNIIEVLPESERQRTYDYLSELYFS